jgi:hypothetical protein
MLVGYAGRPNNRPGQLKCELFYDNYSSPKRDSNSDFSAASAS